MTGFHDQVNHIAAQLNARVSVWRSGGTAFYTRTDAALDEQVMDLLRAMDESLKWVDQINTPGAINAEIKRRAGGE